MKKLYMIAVFLLSNTLAIGQTITILDKSTLQPLIHVSVYSNNPRLSAETNLKGEADLTKFQNVDSIRLRYVSYQEAVFSYKQLKAMAFKVLLSEKPYSLDEVVVSASRFEEKKSDVPQQIQVMKSKDLQFMSQQTTADVLTNSGNVLVQKSQLGGGSPVIRGFEANKVLIVVDGVRMNNAIFRGGHLQNVITMDNSILDKTEILFGPGSVVYGSDALGGVMHFRTKDPILADSSTSKNVQTNAYTRYSSAYTEKTGHVDLNIGLKKIGFLGSVTFSDFGDLRTGNIRNPYYGNWGSRSFYADRINGRDTMIVNPDPNVQKGSGYSQADFLGKIKYAQNSKLNHILNLQYSTSSNINRYDRLTDTRPNGMFRSAQWYYGPQKRFLGSYSFNFKSNGLLFNDSRVIIAYQDITETRHSRNFQNDNLNHRFENVKIWTLNTDFSKNIGEQEIRYGIEASNNQVTSTANLENIRTGVTAPLDTRYPDGGSVVRTLAAYATHTWELSEKLILSDGLRFSNIYLHSKFNDKAFFPFPFDELTQKSNAFNGNLGLTAMPGADWRFTLLGSTGFRAPNVDDVAKVFESVAGRLVVPNADLKPEYTYNLESGISKVIASKIRLETTAYYTWYVDALTVRNATFNGQNTLNYNGQTSQIVTTVNANEAFIYGFNANLAAEITDNFSLSSTLNYTYGRIRTDTTNYPLDHIAPVFGKTSMNLNLKRFRGEFFMLYNGWKRLKDYNLQGEDNQIYALAEGTPAWFTINLRSSYQLNQYLGLQVALENILDQRYRVFASGISAPGRNLSITLRGRF